MLTQMETSFKEYYYIFLILLCLVSTDKLKILEQTSSWKHEALKGWEYTNDW